jgi:hypothetical protein
MPLTSPRGNVVAPTGLDPVGNPYLFQLDANGNLLVSVAALLALTQLPATLDGGNLRVAVEALPTLGQLPATLDGGNLRVYIEGGNVYVPHALLDGTQDNDTAAGVPVAGDLIIAVLQPDASVKWQRIPRGTAEVDFGSTPTLTGVFTVVDATIAATMVMQVSQSGVAPTGKSQDENELDPILFRAVAGSGSFTLYGTALNGPVVGKYKVNYMAR